MGKLLVIASVVISLATAGLGFVNKGALGKTKEDLAASDAAKQAAETKSATAEKTLKAKTDELATAGAEKEQAVAAAAAAEKKAADAQAALADATTKATTAETQIAAITTERDDLKTQLEAAKTGGTPAVAPDQNTELLTQLQEKETLIAKLQNELESTKGATKVYEEKEKMRAAAVLKKGTEGRVLAVNPAWNFVVLNLGDRQNVSNNTELLVKRGTRYLGKVRITSVEPSTSIADIVANSMPQGTTITPGDTVIFQGDEAE
jgi:NADH dehydrogenase/NADH:ubiquinone oxidoreductase subunit G